MECASERHSWCLDSDHWVSTPLNYNNINLMQDNKAQIKSALKKIGI